MIVRAKRLGWDETSEVTQYDILDPYDYDSDDVVGELEVIKVESPYVPSYSNHLVDKQIVDPTTIVPLDNTLSVRALPPAQINRSVLRDANPCPECQANSDPKNIPVHFGCDCSIVTDEIVPAKVSDESFNEFIRFLSQFDVIEPTLIRPGTVVPRNLAVLRDSLVTIGLDFRYADLATYAKQNSDLLVGSLLGLTAQNDSTILMINSITDIPFPGFWSPKVKRSTNNAVTIVFPPDTTEAELAKAYKLLTEWRNAHRQK